ncbi:phosphate regulon transcriptional regulatory protein PhoB [bacterium BMS3Abin03]|nr:phosphate regulon transcriptional regulatory protein PhoB [bacterium BMS3Abin03]
MKLLIIEDENSLADSVVDYLQQEGFTCETALNYDDALLKINVYQYDCIIVDIMLPGGSGLDLVEFLKKKHSDTGIIIISAKNALSDKIRGLDIGADDYLTKPFHLPELNARIKSIIRRKAFEGEQEIVIGDLKILIQAKQVFVKNNLLDLTKKEFDLLIFFVTNKNRVLTKGAIAENLLGDHADLMDSFCFIYTHIKNLRKKIMNAGGKDRIKTIYATGYKFITG